MTTSSTSLQMSTVCFILCKQANIFEKILWDSGRFVFHGGSLFKYRVVCLFFLNDPCDFGRTENSLC